MSSSRSLWRNRDYVGWVAGETLSTLGTSISTFAYPLLILFETGSAAKTGLVAAAGNVGSLATLLVGGALADRYSRRTLLIVGSLVQAVVVGSVALAVLAGHVLVAHVAVAGFMDGAIVGITSGAANAALRRLVPPDDYPTASAQLHGRDMAVRVVGPSLSGLLFAVARAVPFVVDTVSYLASVVGVVAIKRPLGPEPAEQGEREPLRRSFTTGFRFVLGNDFLRFTAAWAASMNMLASGSSLLVVLLLESSGHGAGVIGITRGLGSAGGIAGALFASRVIRRFPGRRLVLALTWCLTAAAFAVAAFPTPVGIAIAFAAVGFVAVPLNVMVATYDMQVVPDHLVGRVSTTLDLSVNAIRWMAPVAVGVLVQATSARTTAVIWACAFVVPSVFVMISRSLRLLDTPIAEVRAATGD